MKPDVTVKAPTVAREVRDTDATPFTSILEALLTRVPGAYAATLVDSEGETVDYCGRGDPFDLRVAAAHLQLALQEVARFGGLGDPRWLVIRGPRKSLAITALPDGYALGLLLGPRSAFTVSPRALDVCVRALCLEAGWAGAIAPGTNERSWFAVRVETDPRGRPLRIDATGTTIAVEVLGAVMGLPVRERGYRVRASDGRELTLVREAKDLWYADEAL